MDQKNLADLYKLDPIPWSRALEALESAEAQKQTPFLATTRPDGRPHVAGVGAIWDNGKVYVVSGPTTRKSRNLRQEPELRGLDVPDGHRPGHRRQGEPGSPTTPRSSAWRSAMAEQGWPAKVKDGAFTYEYSAPSAGPPPWHLYEVTPRTVFGVLSAEPGGATRWRF